MEIAVNTLVFVALASISAFFIFKTQVTLHYGKLLASEEFLAINPRGFQDALSDPKTNKWFFLSQFLLIVDVAYIFYEYAWWVGLCAVLCHFLLFIPVVQRLAPPVDSPKWAIEIYSTLARREADYKRDGDELRYEATKDLRETMQNKLQL